MNEILQREEYEIFPHHHTIEIVGINYYEFGLTPEELLYKKVQLIPEPDNPFDTNAISVRYQGKTVGHVSRYWAQKFSGAMNLLFANNYTPTTTVVPGKKGELRLNFPRSASDIFYPKNLKNPGRRYTPPKTYGVTGEIPAQPLPSTGLAGKILMWTLLSVGLLLSIPTGAIIPLVAAWLLWINQQKKK